MAYGIVNVPGKTGADLNEVKKIAQSAEEKADRALEAVTGISNKIGAVPSQSGTLIYTGAAQSPSWVNFSADQLEISGDTSAVDAGTYTAIFTPKQGWLWADLSQEPVSVTWSIGKANIAAVPSQSGALTYSGSAQSPEWTGYDPAKMTVSGDTTGTNAGNYTAWFTPAENFCWSDSTSAGRNVVWSIGRATIAAVPSQSGALTYSGSAQSPTWSGYDGAKMTLGGDTTGTNAGSYNATFTPGNNYQWSDGSGTAKTVAWSIGKAAGSLTLNKTSLTLTSSAKTGTITATRTGDGKITAKSSDASVATVAVSGTMVTVTAVKTGSATITVTVAAGTNHKAVSKTCTVTVSLIGVYGVSWDGTSTTAWTRTDDAAGFTDPVPAVRNGTGSSPFDNILPWSGMVKSERTGGTMVAIPKFWYTLTQNGAGMKIQISNGAKEGFSVSPAHMDRGDGKGERDVVYIGRYHCAVGTYKSTTGVAQACSMRRSAARTSIHSLGNTIWQMDFAMLFTIWLLYLVEFADWNSQAKIGYGCSSDTSNGGTVKDNMGMTDGMKYHTGTIMASRADYGPNQYRNIEGLWNNVFTWCDGCYWDSRDGGFYTIVNPSFFDDYSNGVLVSLTPAIGVAKAFTVKTPTGGFPVFIPSSTGGNESIYSCDIWDTTGRWIFVGGDVVFDNGYGLFYVGSLQNDGAGANIGCRLQELP